jgi:formate hydrogenlyase transcriptional activator
MSHDKPPRESILIVDDALPNLRLLSEVLGRRGYKVRPASSGPLALQSARAAPPDLILLDITMPEMDGYAVCREIKADARLREVPVLFISALDATLDKVRAFEAGGLDYIPKPFHEEEVLARVEVHLALRRAQREILVANAALEERVAQRTAEIERLRAMLEIENDSLRQEVRDAQSFGELMGRSAALRHIVEQIDMVAPTDAGVLVTGESGTGKELAAREIHRRSARAERPFIKVNCAAVPRELFESEFFGHVKGAFTGAIKERAGRFLAAHGGTLLLDEVGEIPLEMQSKLLRVLQEGEFEPVGDERTVKVDVRMVAATNRDLRAESAAGRFRQDLYFRLNVFPVEMPPLRARPEDIGLLASHFLARAAKKHGRPEPPLRKSHLAELCAYDWPGNIRELQSVIERAVIVCRDGELRFDLPRLAADWGGAATTGGAAAGPVPVAAPVDGAGASVASEEEVRRRERENLRAALERTGWRVAGRGGAAELLGIPATTLSSRMQRLGLSRGKKG